MMRGYGTRIVAGVTPGRGGMEVAGVPVYDTVEGAREKHPGLSASVIFVPPRVAKSAAFEALDADMRFVLLVPERVPQQDMLEIIQRGRDRQAVVIGPNSIGVVSPGRASIGVIRGRMELMRTAFRAGPCGLLSRSGGQTTTLCYYLSKPVVAYVSGRHARPRMRFGHAGAIISPGIGTAEAKIAALRDAGVHVVEHLGNIDPAARRILCGL